MIWFFLHESVFKCIVFLASSNPAKLLAADTKDARQVYVHLVHYSIKLLELDCLDASSISNFQ